MRDFRRRRAAAVEHDASREPLERVLVGHAADADLILAPTPWLGCVRRRREIAVARQEQQPFRFVVEPADRIDVVADAALAQQIDDRRTLLRIRRGW